MTCFKLLSLCAFTACTALPAHAQELNCAPAEAVMADVERQGYQLSFLGETESMGNLVIVTGDKGWLALVDTKDGRMCFLGNGVDWQLKQSGVGA